MRVAAADNQAEKGILLRSSQVIYEFSSQPEVNSSPPDRDEESTHSEVNLAPLIKTRH